MGESVATIGCCRVYYFLVLLIVVYRSLNQAAEGAFDPFVLDFHPFNFLSIVWEHIRFSRFFQSILFDIGLERHNEYSIRVSKHVSEW